MTTMQELLDSAKEEFESEVQHYTYLDDAAHDIADRLVPVYHYDLIQLATDNPWLACEEPELGPAFDGRPTAINIIAAVVYERLSAFLSELVYEYEQAQEELEYE